jgi:hypothetical protein
VTYEDIGGEAKATFRQLFGNRSGLRQSKRVCHKANRKFRSLERFWPKQMIHQNYQGDKSMSSKPTTNRLNFTCKSMNNAVRIRLRQARDWFFQNYFLGTEDAMKIASPGTEGGIFFGMVAGYGNKLARCSARPAPRDLFLKPVASFSCSGSRSDPSSRRAGEVCVQTIPARGMKPHSIMRPGLATSAIAAMREFRR